MWITEALEITENEKPTGKFRLTATSDEDGGGPYGNAECSHDSKEIARKCPACIKFCEGYTGHFPTDDEVVINLAEQALKRSKRSENVKGKELLEEFIKLNRE